MNAGRPVTSVRSANPLRLRGVLIKHDIQFSHLRVRLLRQSGRMVGRPISNADMSMLLLRGWMPAVMREADVRAESEAFLRERGVPESDLAHLWIHELDDTPAKPRNPLDKPPTKKALRAANANKNDEPRLELPEHEMLTTAAKQHFKLFRHPFTDDIQQPSDVFLSADHRYIRESMFYAAKHGGFVAIVGESGSGKSTLRRDMADRVRRDNEAIVLIHPQTIDKTALTSRHICDAIIADLSSEPPKATLEAKARQIHKLLSGSARAGNSHVLIIEEAHDLSVATLKYLKRFWEMEDGFRKLLGIVLIGQPELGDRLDERKNYEAREVIRRCEVARLPPLDAHLEAYIALKFNRVGVNVEEVFDKDAYDAIRTRLTKRRLNSGETESQVYPLVVHNLVVRAMNQAVELGFPRVSGALIAQV